MNNTAHLYDENENLIEILNDNIDDVTTHLNVGDILKFEHKEWKVFNVITSIHERACHLKQV